MECEKAIAVRCLCVTLGGQRKDVMIAQSMKLAGVDITFSPGVSADRLNPADLHSEIGDVLGAFGWSEGSSAAKELLRCIQRCDDGEKKVLACTFAHLRAIIRSSVDADAFDLILEDNVRLLQHHTRHNFGTFMAAVREEGADLWYAGYLGRPTDLFRVHNGDNTMDSAILAQFPAGNIPLWGAYAYGISKEAWVHLRNDIQRRGPTSSFFEDKRQRKRGNRGEGKNRGQLQDMIVLPVDRLLPRRLRSLIGDRDRLLRAVRPLAFRMPPPHPHHLDENGDSKGLPSKIHPSMDNRFFSATTLQLALLFKRQKCQEEESGSKSSASLVGKKSNRWPLNVSGREIIVCWNNVWLSTDERAVVKCFQEDRNALFRSIPGLWERDDTIVNKSGLSSINRDFQGKHTDGTHLRSRLIGWLDEFSLVRDSAKVCIQKELLKVTGSNNVIEETQIAISTIVMPAVFCIGGCLGYTFANSGDIISDSALLLWTAVELFRCSSNICESKSNGSISVVAGRALCFIARHFSRAGYASPAAAIIDLVSKVIREMEVDSAIPRTQVLELVSLLRATVGMQLASTQQGSKVWLTAMSIYEHYSGRDSFPRDFDNTSTKAVVIDVPIDLAIDEFSTDLNDTAVIDFFCRLFLEPRIFKRAGNSDIDIGTIEFELYSLTEAQCSAECSSVSGSSSEVSSRLIKVAKELSCKCLEVPSLKSGRLSSSIQDQWLTRWDCDQAIVKLIILRHQLQADIGDAMNTDIDDSTIADKNDDGCGVRSVIRDWFRGFAAISVRGSSGLNTGSSFASMPNIEPQAHLLPDTKSYCDAVQVLCDLGRPHDACWLLQTIASGIGTGYHRTMALTSDLRDPLRILLVGASAVGHCGVLEWVLHDGGLWSQFCGKEDDDENTFHGSKLPYRVSRAVMKNIGNGLLALNHDALRTMDVLRIAKQVLMKSIHVEHSDSSKVVGEGNGRQAHCLLQVLFTSAVANGSLEGVAAAIRWRHKLLPPAVDPSTTRLLNDIEGILAAVVERYETWRAADKKLCSLFDSSDDETISFAAGIFVFLGASMSSVVPRLLVRSCYSINRSCYSINFHSTSIKTTESRKSPSAVCSPDRVRSGGGGYKLVAKKRDWLQWVTVMCCEQKHRKYGHSTAQIVHTTGSDFGLATVEILRQTGWLNDLSGTQSFVGASCVALRWALLFSEIRGELERASLINEIRDGYAALIKFNVDGISVATDLLLAATSIVAKLHLLSSDRSASKLTKLAIEVLLNKVRTGKKMVELIEARVRQFVDGVQSNRSHSEDSILSFLFPCVGSTSEMCPALTAHACTLEAELGLKEKDDEYM